MSADPAAQESTAMALQEIADEWWLIGDSTMNSVPLGERQGTVGMGRHAQRFLGRATICHMRFTLLLR
jgi:hypothetical protein